MGGLGRPKAPGRVGPGVRWVPVLLCVVLLAPPIVQAAHVHDHRYMVTGRVLDDEGLPAGQVSVRAELTGTESFVPAQATRTNCMGDFQAVFRAQAVDGAEVRVEVLGRTATQDADPILRRTFVKLEAPSAQSPPACQDERANFTSQHVVTGRLIGPGGQPLAGQAVDVVLPIEEGSSLEANGTTNAAGDFAVFFQNPRLTQADTVEITAAGDTWIQTLDKEHRITVADHVQEATESSSRWVLAGVLVLLALGGVAFLIWQRQT